MASYREVIEFGQVRAGGGGVGVNKARSGAMKRGWGCGGVEARGWVNVEVGGRGWTDQMGRWWWCSRSSVVRRREVTELYGAGHRFLSRRVV